MSSTRPKEELIIHAGSAKGSWEIQIAVGLWEERWSQSPFFLSSCKLKIAGYLDFGKTFQSWIVFLSIIPGKLSIQNMALSGSQGISMETQVWERELRRTWLNTVVPMWPVYYLFITKKVT